MSTNISPQELHCNYCGRTFAMWYISATWRAGAWHERKHKGLALANFNKHVAACKLPLEDDDELPF